MTHRTVIRLFSAVLLAVLVLGCGDDSGPTDAGPFLVVDPLSIGVDEGTTAQLTATLAGQAVQVTWASSNTAVATVSSTGLVTGVTPGFAAVTATMTSDPAQLRSSSVSVLALQGIGLTSGVPLTGLASDVDVLYRIFVPAGATSLTVTTSGGPGDADLLVQRQTPPPGDFSSFDCASAGGTNNESCAFAAPASGTWYILISAFVAYSGLTLTATVSP